MLQRKFANQAAFCAATIKQPHGQAQQNHGRLYLQSNKRDAAALLCSNSTGRRTSLQVNLQYPSQGARPFVNSYAECLGHVRDRSKRRNKDS